MKQTSRREFLKLAGKGMLGAAALSTVPAMLPALAEGAEAPAWPWAYKKMDKEAVLKHGYECFYSPRRLLRRRRSGDCRTVG